jgi:multidrug efflux system outer membrane protein
MRPERNAVHTMKTLNGKSDAMTARSLSAATLLLSLTLSACAVGPKYEAPQTADAEIAIATDASLNTASFEAAWWRQFGDPVLDDLVSRALEGDLDLRMAVARVREARALFRDARLDYAPAVTAHGGYQKQDAPLQGTTQSVELEAYELGFDASWELDLFGRVRHGVSAARADAEAAEAQLRDAQVQVAAEVAREYFNLRGAQQRLAVAERNLDNQREALRLTRVRLELGAGDELDVQSASARLMQTEATVPPLITAERAAAYRLAVLLGLRPGSLQAELVAVPVTPRVTGFAIGEPYELLRRRPDVRAAERALAAQTARVGMATADLYPRLDITGFFGFVSGSASALGDSDTRAWIVAPTLTWSAFDLGSARARLAASEAQADAQLAVYEKTVLLALEETQNSFVAWEQDQKRLAALVAQADASRRAAELARIRYREGAVDFLRLLDAERTVLEAEDTVTLAEAELNIDVVAIYKALGGGWEAAPDPLASLQ